MKKIMLLILVSLFLFSCSGDDSLIINSEGNISGGGNGTPIENTISR